MKINKVLFAVSAIALSLAEASTHATGSYRITLTPVLMPARLSPSWPSAAQNAVNDAMNGYLIFGSRPEANPTNYVLCSGKINAGNLEYALATPLWDGLQYPPAPYNNELGQVVWSVLDIMSSSSTDDLSLSMLQVRFNSSDPNNILGDTQSYMESTYTPEAIGVRADGSVVNGGPSTQMVHRVIFIVQSKLFNGGDSQSAIIQEQDWIAEQVSLSGDFSLEYSAQVMGDPTSLATATVYIVHSPLPPKLILTGREGYGVYISVDNGTPTAYYTIYSAPTIDGSWSWYAILQGKNQLGIPTGMGTFFFRAVTE